MSFKKSLKTASNVRFVTLPILKKYYPRNKFFTDKFSFVPTLEDWRIIRKYIFTINLYVTNRCNTFCKVCFRNSSPLESKETDLSIDEIKHIVKLIGKHKQVVLIGGEPTVREDIFDIIKIIKKSGNSPQLYTNGLKLADILYVKKLKEAGIERVILSFDGFSYETYRKLRGSPKELYSKLVALRNLEAMRIPTFLSMTVMKSVNDSEVEKVLDFVVNSVKKGGVIRGVYFYGATKFGRWPEYGVETYVKDIIEALRNSKYKINPEYLVEFKKLLLLLYQKALKFRKFFPTPLFPFSAGSLVGIYRVGSLKELIPLGELKKLNKKIDKFGKLNIVPLLKNIGIKFLIKILLRGISSSLLSTNLLFIGLGNVHTESNAPRGVFFDVLGIEKNKKMKRTITNKYTSYAYEDGASDDV